MIYLTSFAKSYVLPSRVERYSAAVYQPKGFDFPKADWADIRDASGEWIRPRRYKSLDEYRKTLLDHYGKRYLEIRQWMFSKVDDDIALCCWCPYEQAAQRQLEQFGSFVCHTSVLGESLNLMGYEVWYDSDRLHMAVLTQK